MFPPKKFCLLEMRECCLLRPELPEARLEEAQKSLWKGWAAVTKGKGSAVTDTAFIKIKNIAILLSGAKH